MTIGNARLFIKRGINESSLRLRLNNASDPDDLKRILKEEALLFSAHDFEEAFTNKLTQCQEADEAANLKEFRMWWILLSRASEP